MRIGIYGAGGFGRELIQPLRLSNPAAELLFIDDAGGDTNLLPVAKLSQMRAGDSFVVAVSDSRLRARLEAKALGAGLAPLSLFHPGAEIGPDVSIGQGAVFCANTMVTACARIGRQFHCNIYSYVAHDCVIGDYVTFGPRVNCNGNIHIGDHAYIGTGAMIRQGTHDKPLTIGEGAVVGMGAVVTKDVAPFSTVVGNPAKPIERQATRLQVA